MMNKKDKWVEKRFNAKFPNGNFDQAMMDYSCMNDFPPDGNAHDFIEPEVINDESHYIMRLHTQWHLTKAFKAMRIDLDNHNVTEDMANGNIGTPGRIAKVWNGGSANDDRELGGGRWTKMPRLATFPNDENMDTPITKRVDIISNCSHHFIPFTTIAKTESYAIISYVPDDFVLGISKLQRVADWVSQRFFLQEDLTRALYEEISAVTQSTSVYVGLFDMVHGCESFRGAKAKDGTFTSEYYGGYFEDPEARKMLYIQNK
jgi:GTP cyclohydrolase I